MTDPAETFLERMSSRDALTSALAVIDGPGPAA